MKNKWMAALALAFCAATAQAYTVEVTQVFHDVAWTDHGTPGGLSYGKTVSGDWTFEATLEYPSENHFFASDLGGSFALTGITLTQASLGLVDAAITNLHFVNYIFNKLQFAYGNDYVSYPGTTLLLPVEYGDFAFSDLVGPVTIAGGRVVSDADGFIFSDGSGLYGSGTASSTTLSASIAAPVPEPETWLAMMVGLGTLVAGRAARKRSAVQPEPLAAA
jgi:hypothetical protein